MNVNAHIDLLRHGETEGGICFRGSTDGPLTTLGWTQLWAAIDKNELCWGRIGVLPFTRAPS